jgi:hypothetical protein
MSRVPDLTILLLFGFDFKVMRGRALAGLSPLVFWANADCAVKKIKAMMLYRMAFEIYNLLEKLFESYLFKQAKLAKIVI